MRELEASLTVGAVWRLGAESLVPGAGGAWSQMLVAAAAAVLLAKLAGDTGLTMMKPSPAPVELRTTVAELEEDEGRLVDRGMQNP